MEQLTGADTVFLAIETPGAPGHVGGLTVLDTSETPDFGYERLCEVVGERIRLVPRFTQKLREVPLGLDRPYLVDDRGFDVRNHVHRIAVPAPGGMRELAELCGHLFARPLHRDRPLWEMWLIEGVAQGRFATLMKSHHCLMDGMAGAGLGEILCDLEAHPKSGPSTGPVPGSPSVSELEMAWRAANHLAGMPSRLVRMGGRLLRQGAVMAVGALRSDPAAPPLPTSVPATRFNRSIGPRRAFACSSLPLDEVKAVKKHFDVTVNDVILAVTGSAIAGYLRERGELPERPLVALIAVSTREEGDTSVGNRVTTVPVNWATDVGDPVQRLLRIHRNALRAKELARHHDADLLSGLGEAIPPGLTNLVMRTFGASTSGLAKIGNVVVSNVRATPVPLYTAGARIESMYPMSVLASGQGLNVTVVSYMGRVDVGFTVDPDLVPGVWQLADAIPDALAELTAAVGRGAARRAA